jgi:putative spermidine/putrescine transport system ATP-binding protein/mannopine transport system ATP-binding protein
VTVAELRKSYGAVRAVDGVGLAVGAGEFVALLGPSGSGKTTILMSIAGFETPDSGTIAIGGRDVTAVPAARRGIGMVFQRYALFPHMTVAENIAFPLRMRGIRGAAAAAKVEAALALVRLAGYGGRGPAQLSGGQQQRVALARALVYDPPLLLMDEPLGALDKNLREQMQLEIKQLQRQLGTTVIYVTHDQGEALTMADRIAVLADGRVQQFASPQDLYERPENEFVAGFVGETNFIDGTLRRAQGRWLLAIEGSAEAAALAGEGAGWRDGAAARLAIRPELIRPGLIGSGSEDASPLLRGSVEDSIYGGGTVACVLRVTPALRLTARFPSVDGPDLRPGMAAALTWPAERARVFLR